MLRLDAVDAAEIEGIRRANSCTTLKRLQIGIGRGAEDHPEANGAALRWTPVGGGLAAHWQVTSPEARAFRVGLVAARMAPGTESRFSGSARMDTLYSPLSAADAKPMGGIYRSPVGESHTPT